MNRQNTNTKNVPRHLPLPKTGNDIEKIVPASWRRGWLFGLFLIIVTMLAYQPAWHAGFVWDDNSWTTGISGLLRNFSGLRLMWSDPTALQQYYPLSGTTFWIDYQLWGFWPTPYHVENILLHSCAALLFWKLLQKLEVPGAWLAAGIFALHPVMVESVAWVTERKNVLSMVLFWGALLAYGRFNSFWKADTDSRRRWSAYALAFFLFFAALLAKTTALSFPAVILLICWWKNARIQWHRDILPTLPFFGLAIALGWMTAWLEKNHLDATGPDFAMTFPQRCLVAGRAPWFYLEKLFWPENLCFIYPRWKPDAVSWWQWLFPMVALAGLIALWFGQKKTGRGPVAAVFFFVGTLFPVLGFMSAYGMLYSFVWDHWVYLSSLGIMALSASVIVQTAGRFHRPKFSGGFIAALLLVLAILTWRQCRMYSDIETLWQTTIARNPACWMAHNNLGLVLFQKGNVDEAIVQYQRALQINPGIMEAHNNLGNALIQKGDLEGAIAQYQQALQINPDYVDAHYNFGSALLQKGRVDEAINHFQKALQINSDHANAHNNLGLAFFQKRQMDEALGQFKAALKLDPNHPDADFNAGNVCFQMGRLDEAVVYYQKALGINPNDAEVHNNLGTVLLHEGHMSEAVQHWQRALEIQPDCMLAQNNLAWVLATCPDASVRNAAKAVELAKSANQLSGGKSPAVLQILAAAYAEDRQFDDAITTARRALQLAPADKALAKTIQGQITTYQEGLPFRDTDLTNSLDR